MTVYLFHSILYLLFIHFIPPLFLECVFLSYLVTYSLLVILSSVLRLLFASFFLLLLLLTLSFVSILSFLSTHLELFHFLPFVYLPHSSPSKSSVSLQCLPPCTSFPAASFISLIHCVFFYLFLSFFLFVCFFSHFGCFFFLRITLFVLSDSFLYLSLLLLSFILFLHSSLAVPRNHFLITCYNRLTSHVNLFHFPPSSSTYYSP